MIRKFALALAAVAAIGAAGISTSTDAVAGPKGWHKGGIHVGIGFGPGYGYGWRHRGARFAFYAPAYDYDCFKVRTKRGTRIVCRY
jgi:hypothetical protein